MDNIRNQQQGGTEKTPFPAADYEKNMQTVVDKLLTVNYEFLGLIDVATGALLVFGEHMDMAEAAHCGIYDNEMPRVFRGLILPEYYEEGVRTMSRHHVIDELERKENYSCSFPAQDFAYSHAGRKQWTFCYLDVEKVRILMIRTDITDLYTAEYDPLTGLYNRQAFYRHAREILGDNQNEPFVLIRCDIDRFKTYNDIFGALAGDRLLAQFGRAARQYQWPWPSAIGRIEADHFCGLFPKRRMKIEQWNHTHETWLAGIAQGYRLTSSVGVYEITEPELDVSLMCDRALLALHMVKDSYTQKVGWYDDTLRCKLQEEQELLDGIEEALREGQFVLYFQPQVNCTDGSLIGAEVLVRWQHPKRGLLLPGKFIPLFEKNGFISKMDDYVWEESCRFLRKCLNANEHPCLPLSVNISRYDLYNPALCEKLLALTRQYDLPVGLLKLEITESAYMENPEQLIGVVKELKHAGFIVEMDDFGSGYSSLNLLKDVPVDVIKLDVRFLSEGEDNARGGLILSSVIRMARWLQLSVVAEGVETKEQAEYLKSLSCFYLQGYYFGRPMPADMFETLLKRDKIKVPDNAEDTDFAGVDTIWNPASPLSLFFSRLMEGTAILEYHDGNAGIVRANDQFYLELKTTREAYQSKQARTLDRFDEANQIVYLEMLERAVATGEKVECEVQSLPHEPGGQPFRTRNRVRLLTKNKGHALLYLSTVNITNGSGQKEGIPCG